MLSNFRASHLVWLRKSIPEGVWNRCSIKKYPWASLIQLLNDWIKLTVVAPLAQGHSIDIKRLPYLAVRARRSTGITLVHIRVSRNWPEILTDISLKILSFVSNNTLFRFFLIGRKVKTRYSSVADVSYGPPTKCKPSAAHGPNSWNARYTTIFLAVCWNQKYC